MTDPKSDFEIERELQHLPCQPASPQFTPKVLAALDKNPHRQEVFRPALVWSAVMALILAALLTWSFNDRPSRTAEAPRDVDVERIKGERERLQQELALLQREIEAVPVLYLSGDENLDLVLDLGGAARTGIPAALGANPDSEIQRPRPANYRN